MSGCSTFLKIQGEQMKTFIVSCLISIAILAFYSFSAFNAGSADVIFRVSILYLLFPLSILVSMILISIEHFVLNVFHIKQEDKPYKPCFAI